MAPILRWARGVRTCQERWHAFARGERIPHGHVAQPWATHVEDRSPWIVQLQARQCDGVELWGAAIAATAAVALADWQVDRVLGDRHLTWVGGLVAVGAVLIGTTRQGEAGQSDAGVAAEQGELNAT